jgi:4-alpha-glucanotransferase
MGSDTFEELLDRAAALRGIEPGYWDIFGRYHPTTAAGKQAILRAMGWAADSAAELQLLLAEHTRREWARLAPATIVALEGETVELPLNLPADSLGEPVTLTVRCEDGETQVCQLQAGELAQTGSIDSAGRTCVRVSARSPVELPLGYHEIAIQCGSAQAVTRYIVAPIGAAAIFATCGI